jgi:hypothetical protein
LRATQLLDRRSTPTTTPMTVASAMPTMADAAVLTTPTRSASRTGWPGRKFGS